MRTRAVTLPCAVALCGFDPCGPPQDPDAIAAALADRLTDALDFEDADTRLVPQPRERAGDPDFPQVTGLIAPAQLELGQALTVDLTTDFADTARIAGAVVWVQGAEHYIDVRADYDEANARVRLYGRLREDEALQDNSFVIRLALLDDEGLAGNYVTWTLDVGEGGELPRGHGPATITDYEADPPGSELLPASRQTYQYDGSGRLTTITSEDHDGSDWVGGHRYVIAYDAQGRFESETTEDYDAGTYTPSSRDVATYGADGRVEPGVREDYVGDTWTAYGRRTFMYDAQGRITEVYTEYDDTGWQPCARETFSYDSAGLIQVSTNEDLGSCLLFSFRPDRGEYSYNADGLVLSMTSYDFVDPDYTPQSRADFGYDTSGRMTTSSNFDISTGDDVPTSRSTVTYDANDRVQLIVNEEYLDGAWQVGSREEVTWTDAGSSAFWESYPDPLWTWAWEWGSGQIGAYTGQ